MKKKFLLSVMAIMLTIVYAKAEWKPVKYHYNEPVLITVRNVDFLIFTNGEFDFKPQNSQKKLKIERNKKGVITKIGRVNISYNNRGQVKHIGKVVISYNRHGLISSIGRHKLYYDKHRNYRVKKIGKLFYHTSSPHAYHYHPKKNRKYKEHHFKARAKVKTRR